MPMPEGGFKTPHEAAPACSDANAVAWANAYKSQQKPTRSRWMDLDASWRSWSG